MTLFRYGRARLPEHIRIAGCGTVEEIIMTDRAREGTINLTVANETPARISVSVVADDPGFREALAFQLVTAGFEISAHPSAESFLESGRLKDTDCVIADIYLPRMNGLQLLAEIKRSMSCAQVVFLTGCGDVACGVQAMREGAVDYLEKPVDDQRLLDAVMRAAELASRKRAENAQCGIR